MCRDALDPDGDGAMDRLLTTAPDPGAVVFDLSRRCRGMGNNLGVVVGSTGRRQVQVQLFTGVTVTCSVHNLVVLNDPVFTPVSPPGLTA